MIHARIHSLWGTGNLGSGMNHSYLIGGACGVGFLLQCVRVQLIVFHFD